MSKLEDILSKTSVEVLAKVPQKICDFLIINIDEYQEFLKNDKEKKDKIDTDIINFKKSRDFIGFYNKVSTPEQPINYRLFVKSVFNSKKVCERKLLDYLKGL